MTTVEELKELTLEIAQNPFAEGKALPLINVLVNILIQEYEQKEGVQNKVREECYHAIERTSVQEIDHGFMMHQIKNNYCPVCGEKLLNNNDNGKN